MTQTFLKTFLAIGLSLGLAGTALASERCAVPDYEFLQPNADDRARIEALETYRTRGMAQALISTDVEARTIVSQIFANEFQAIEPDKISLGNYQCRTIKLGGISDVIAYQWFTCEINNEEDTITVRKVTGSQNFLGFMKESGGSLFYRGASHYGYEDGVRFYGDDPEHDQIGCFSAIDQKAGHYILELPGPQFESLHDVIEFKKVR